MSYVGQFTFCAQGEDFQTTCWTSFWLLIYVQIKFCVNWVTLLWTFREFFPTQLDGTQRTKYARMQTLSRTDFQIFGLNGGLKNCMFRSFYAKTLSSILSGVNKTLHIKLIFRAARFCAIFMNTLPCY